ncbi:hyalin [Enterococcus saigonensis]|uniref:Hyalin n=1 Tax=Enterococcus saigonensis TaxID=1805431 RepID=A0A679IS00_9ENTE|nr:LysR family transcriptional regulator [Enterococcus saigonensis]BCA86944.1 hyalin [Enterococcus saigonensis]
MINEKHIHYLLTVANEHSITAAAKKLFISQPALSRFIREVERTIGTPLFIRDRGNLHLTKAGEIYLKGCQDVWHLAQSTTKEITELTHGHTGKITLGVTPLTGEFVFPAILDTFSQAFPHVELTLQEERMSVLYERVKKGAVDIALVYQNHDPELTFHYIYENPIYIQVPPSFAVKNEIRSKKEPFTAISPTQLANQAMILLKKGREMREIATSFFENFQIVPAKILETENIHLASNLVSLDKGFTFVPAIFCRKRQPTDSNFYVQLDDYPLKRELFCCHRKNAYLTEAEQFLIRELPKILA